MQNPLVSYIIPCYNVEVFLAQCVHSILGQTYTSLEIILVDDGSKDATPQLCEELALGDSRIKVIHQTNQGSSAARNVGLKMAKGDYVLFLDGDDFWRDEATLAQLMEQMTPDLDILFFNCAYYYPDSNTYKEWTPFPSELSQVHDLQSAFPILLSHGITPMSPCLKIIRRAWLEETGLSFRQGIVAEDIPWFISMLEHNPRVACINTYPYAYRQNTISSVTRASADRSFNNLIAIVEEEYRLAANRELQPAAKEALLSFLAYEYCILLGLVGDTKDKEVNLKRLQAYTSLLHYRQNPKVKLAYMVYHMAGIRCTALLLNRYYHHQISKK